MMKIFISWSGELSETVALLLRSWIQNVIQVVEPYVSSEDIEKGSRWFSEIDGKLEACDFGIICLTRENMTKPWVLFESGAISRSINRSRVTPLLVDLSPAELSGPLAHFQATTISEVDMQRLIKSINSSIDDSRFDDTLIERAFYKWWPDLEKSIGDIIKSARQDSHKAQIRSDRELLEELLLTTRNVANVVSRYAPITQSPKSQDDIDLSDHTGEPQNFFGRIINELERRRKIMLALCLEKASLSIERDQLIIVISFDNQRDVTQLRRANNINILREICEQVLGRPLTQIKVKVLEQNGTNKQVFRLIDDIPF